MTSELPKRENPLNRLSDLLEEHLLQASDQELDEIAREWGVDPEKGIESVDAAFRESIRSENQARMAEAKALRQREIAKLQELESELPRDRGQLLALLEAKLQNMRKDSASRVTILHRNLEELTEEGLCSLLRQLSALDHE